MSPAAAAGFTGAAFPSVGAAPVASTTDPVASARGAKAGTALAAGVAAAGSLAVCGATAWPRRRGSAAPGAVLPAKRAHRRVRLNPLAADAIAGAAGELVQIAVLYPLDTLKVVCQAYDCSAKDALRRLLPPGRPALSALPALYRGCLPAAGLSAVVGALYLVAFTGGRALAMSAPDKAEASTRRRSLGARPVEGAAAAAAAATATTPPLASMTASTTAAMSGYGGPATAAAAAAATAGAAASCLATSLIESPLEMFRHRMQAGVAGGAGLAAQAVAAVRAGGPRELYRGYASFLLKSFPYDAAELVTYALLADAGASVARCGVAPPSVTGAVVGALAGAAAVVASMPADCIKLRLELATTPPPVGTRAAVRQFFGTGAAIAAGPGGARALFRGLGPRLAEKVPSTAAYWLVVEGVRRALREFVVDEEVGGEVLAVA